MAIGSRKGSARGSLRAPKFLDAPGGLYGRLGEPEGPGSAGATEEEAEEERGRWDAGPPDAMAAQSPGDPGGEGFDANDGVTEGDDGETLLRVVKRGGGGGGGSGRWSRRGRRSSRRKQRDPPSEPAVAPDESSAPSAGGRVTGDGEPMGALARSVTLEDADDQVLLRDKKRGREEEEEEGEEERKLKREQEEGMKALKGSTVKNYRKALDRAFRRGWEAFVTNLYSVTLTPVTSTAAAAAAPSPKSSQKSLRSTGILCEFQ